METLIEAAFAKQFLDTSSYLEQSLAAFFLRLHGFGSKAIGSRSPKSLSENPCCPKCDDGELKV